MIGPIQLNKERNLATVFSASAIYMQISFEENTPHFTLLCERATEEGMKAGAIVCLAVLVVTSEACKLIKTTSRCSIIIITMFSAVPSSEGCEDADCVDIDCPGSMYTPPGGCCPVCMELDCNNAHCPGGKTCFGGNLVVPDGKCCSTCRPFDCNITACEAVPCDKYNKIWHDNECCPTCETTTTDDCGLVECSPLTCTKNEQTTPDDECCPVCLTLNCGSITCTDEMRCFGGTLVTPEGECCPVCETDTSGDDNDDDDDCQYVDCTPPPCDENDQITPEDECCPVCRLTS